MNRSLTNIQAARNVRVDAFVAQMHQTERAAVARAIEQHNVAELERSAIAKRIKQARREAGLSQPEMAEALGVIARTYQNYESIKEPRTPWSLMGQIATITGKTTEWLIHGDLRSNRATTDGHAQLDRIEQLINQRTDQATADLSQQMASLEGAIETQNQNLDAQTGVLNDLTNLVREIRNLVEVLQDAEVIERSAAAAVRSLPEWPPPPSAAPAQEPQQATGTTDRGRPRVQGQPRKRA